MKPRIGHNLVFYYAPNEHAMRAKGGGFVFTCSGGTDKGVSSLSNFNLDFKDLLDRNKLVKRAHIHLLCGIIISRAGP